MTMTQPDQPTKGLQFITDIRVLRVAFQLLTLILVIAGLAVLFNNGRLGLQRIGLTPSFSFLNTPSNTQVFDTWIPHGRTDTYAHLFLVGVVNTLRVIFIGLILTTIWGILVGVGRLSSNWLVRNLARVYVEILQNTPLLVQLVFLYAIFLSLPPARESITLPGPIYLSVRGVAMPGLWPTDTTALWTVIATIGWTVGLWFWRIQRRKEIETGQRTYAAEIGTAITLGVAGLAAIVLRPYTISLPAIQGPRYANGLGVVVTQEFTAIVVGLVLYTSAYVAEVVRSGIQAIPNGQWEAARAQGFGYFQTLRLIILPQALRVMIPPMTNQYLNLIKNSSLASVVGYQDIFGVGKTGFESGQTVPVVILVMVLYLVINLITAFFMNLVNQRAQFKVR